MKQVYSLFAVLIATLLFTALSATAKEKLNVLFIAADDLNCDLNSFGVKQVKTPNLDRLAKMGAFLPNAGVDS